LEPVSTCVRFVRIGAFGVRGCFRSDIARAEPDGLASRLMGVAVFGAAPRLEPSGRGAGGTHNIRGNARSIRVISPSSLIPEDSSGEWLGRSAAQGILETEKRGECFESGAVFDLKGRRGGKINRNETA
jgi:hypothetical protein